MQDYSCLTKFLLDIDCLDRLSQWTDNVNLFDVFKISNLEIRHSNFLAWLLDSAGTHGLGDSFLRPFIANILKISGWSDEEIIPFLVRDNIGSYYVYRELDHMDIVVESEEIRFVIENKVFSGEGEKQLEQYEAGILDDVRTIFVYLTPDGLKASREKWINISYDLVLSIVESILNKEGVKPGTAFLLRQYVETIRRDIMKEKDEKLYDICYEIYRKHQAALRLIFDNIRIDQSMETDIMVDVLRSFEKDEKIIYPSKGRWEFYTKSMDEYLPLMSENNSSWNTNRSYKYWFEKLDDKLVIHFELGGKEISEDLKKKHTTMIEVQNGRQGEYTYRRLYRAERKIKQGKNYEESLRKAIGELVYDVLHKEIEWIKLCESKIEEIEKNAK